MDFRDVGKIYRGILAIDFAPLRPDFSKSSDEINPPLSTIRLRPQNRTPAGHGSASPA
jgi:hypothetical protein